MRRHLATLLALLAVLVAGCRSPEERLADRKRDLRDALDRLYAEYGGSDLARELSGAKDPDAGRGREEGSGGGVVGRFVKELDRSHFEEGCLAVGRGERPFLLSDRLAEFLEDARHARECREAARIEGDVAALEREVQARR